MLSEKEKHGMAELLGRMDKSDLFSLSQTVTSRLILPETASEAITSIILHTDRASDLLKRKKMRKEFLFKYLHDRGVEGVEAASDKTVIVRHVLTLWESNERSLMGSSLALTSSLSVGSSINSAPEEDSLPEAPAPSRNTSYSSLCSLDLYSGSHHPPSLSMILNRTTSSSSTNLQSTMISEDSNQGPPIAMELKRSESNWSFMEECSNDTGGPAAFGHSATSATDTSSNTQFGIGLGNSPSSINPAPPIVVGPAAAGGDNPANHQFLPPLGLPPTLAETQNGIVSNNITTIQAQEMANTFVKWYYELLNSKSSDFRSDHFFPDASAKISLQSQNNSDPAEYFNVQENGKQVCSTLFEIAMKYKLTFNPNLCRDGVSGALDPHGLVIVNVCGTLHNNSNSVCCGTFQQQFGLVRDPFEGNNWKIKFTNANLVSKAPQAVGVGDIQVPILQQIQHPEQLGTAEHHGTMALS